MITAAQTQTLVNQVSTTRLMATVNTLSAFLTRHIGSVLAQDVADSVEGMFAAAGITETSQQKWLHYDGGDEYLYGYYDIINVIAEIPGMLFPDKYIDVIAHHDSFVYDISYPDTGYEVRAPGADDNGTGVAALVEMAKLIKDSGFRPLITIRFISYSAEEVGGLGVQERLALSTDGILLCLNMDMIGYAPTASDASTVKLHPYDTDDNGLDGGYSYYDQAVIAVPTYAALTVTRGNLNSHSSDSLEYFNQGLPAIYFEEKARSPYYHYNTDLPATLNQAYFTECTKAVFACLCVFSGITQQLNTTAAVSNNMINYNLSTLSSLARHEAEINNLAQRYTRKALSVAATVQMTANPDTITAITAMTSAGTAVTLVKGGGMWALPLGEYVRFICATQSDYFSLLEGTGSVVTSAGGNYTLALASAPTWTDAELVKDWQNKIDLANQMIYDTIYASLATKVSGDSIDDIIDEIVNPEILSLASDYKTLELIFMDLYGKVGTSESIERKLAYYKAKYQEMMNKSLIALDFGDYGYVFANTMGSITR